MKLTTIFALVVGSFSALSLKSAVTSRLMPRGLFDVTPYDDRDHVEYILSRHDAALDEKRTTDPSASSPDDCQAPDHEDVIINSTATVIAVDWSNLVSCEPIEVPVKITQRAGVLPVPSFARLFRCMGEASTFAPNLKHCTVKRKEEVTVNYFDLNNNFNAGSVVMYNHTQCGKECIVKGHHCNNETENHNNCRCECMVDYSYCSSTWQTFNPSKCECECSISESCSLFQEWDPKTCKCVCSKAFKELCEQANHVFVPSTCSCVVQNTNTTVCG